MKEWDEDKQKIVESILDELNLLTSESEKFFVLIEAMKELDESKMPPTMRKSLKGL